MSIVEAVTLTALCVAIAANAASIWLFYRQRRR